MSNGTSSRKARRQHRQAQEIRRRLLGIALGVGLLIVAITAVAFLLPGMAGASVTLTHVHGLGFSPDGEQLVVPAHDGLRVYEDGEWFNPDVPERDYMGFTPVDVGFYSSGHPGPADTLPNPLGLVRSSDLGATVETLAFLGESDFHLMAVGYENHAIYVINTIPNSNLDTGLYHSLDDGETWAQAAAAGITARPFALAVHPTSESTVAMATEVGLFLSDDFGASFVEVMGSVGKDPKGNVTFITFNPLNAAGMVTAVTFHPNGEALLFGSTELFAYQLRLQEVTHLSAPQLQEGDSMSYIAVNPMDHDEVAVATFNRDIYLSDDGGENWVQIADDGEGL